jgi:hypothetical protein
VVLTYNARAFLEKRGLTRRGFAGRDPRQIEEAMAASGFNAISTTQARDSANRLFFATRGTRV